jgi:sugar O-acyltransferase (sialic acid O-acetyltransferase NeuD family)
MIERAVYLVGGGGHGAVVLDALLRMDVSVAGIVDGGLAGASAVFGVPVVGSDAWLDRCDPATVLLANGVGRTPHESRRQEIFERFSRRGFGFIAVRHPSAQVGRDASFGDASQVMAGAVVQCRARIGRNAVINTGASVDHDCVVGDHAFVGPGATLCGEVSIGEGAFLGAGAVVLPGIAVGDRAVVGAGAVVARNVPAGARVKGVPARAEGARP